MYHDLWSTTMHFDRDVPQDEARIVDESFAAQIVAGFTCTDVTTLFDVTDTAAPSNRTRLNTIFVQLSSYQNPDFLGMDKKYNGFKGCVSSYFPSLTYTIAPIYRSLYSLFSSSAILRLANV